MRRTWTIVLFEHEQPNGRARRAVRRLVEEWNRDETPKFERLAGRDWHIGLDATTQDRLERLRAELARHGVEFHLSWRDHIEDEDYATADFVAVLGAEPNLTVPFLRNEKTAFVPASPCQVCGSTGAYGVVQAEPLVIDGAQLDRSLADLPPPGDGGWDMITLPTGRVLVSARLVAALADGDVAGYQTEPVIDAATGETSPQLAQLVADKAVLIPCPDHSSVEGGSFCPACGTSYGILDGYFRIQDSWIGQDEILSRDPGKGSTFYVSRRVHDILSSASPNGVRRYDVMMVCRHQQQI